jgi:serine/threonine protein kinase
LKLGSYGSVFQCREVKTGKLFAIKFLELDAKQNEIVDIINEINILKASTNCSNIGKLHKNLYFNQ